MGAENSVLEGCSWEDELVCPKEFLWRVTPIKKTDGTDGVVFQARNKEKKDSELLQKCAKTLLRLRHPNVIRFLGSGHSSKGFWLATEPVIPILSSVSNMTSDELAAGVHDVLQALDFMHAKLGVCHNNVCPSSVYVCKDGGWKLGGMEHACKFQEATPEFLDSCRVFRDEASIAPEEKAGQLKLDISVGHSRDVFAVGALVDSLMDMVEEKDELLRELEQQITICVSVDPSQRPAVATLLEYSIFRSDFTSIISFVRNVTVKTEDEKKIFFGNLLQKLRNLPESVIARRMVVPLLSRFVLLDEVAATSVLPYLLVPRREETAEEEEDSSCNLLSESVYKEYVIPHLCNIFLVHDCHIRMTLLKYFPSYAHLFTRQQLEEDIFLQVLLGVRDSNDDLVAASLKALAELVPILGGDYVIGGPRKTFFFHGIPKQVTVEMAEPKRNGPLNVASMLSKAGPTLLKDIAAGAKQNSTTATITTEDREKKMKERQHRRDEAKLKREERRRKLKEKQFEEKQESPDASQLKYDGHEAFQTPTIEDIAKKMDDFGRLPSDSVSNEEPGEFSGKEGRADNDLLEGEDSVMAKETDASDWSDWEDENANIDDEIEEELRGMPSPRGFLTSTVTEINNKVPTSPSPYRRSSSPTSVTADWSDMPEADRTALLFSTTSTMTAFDPRVPGDGGVVPEHSKHKSILLENGTKTLVKGSTNGVGNTPPSNMPRTGKSLKLTSSSTTTHSSTSSNGAKPAPAKTPKSLNDLGLGYDIKSIEIKSSHSESDFFADMAPKISLPAKPDILSAAKASSSSPSLSDGRAGKSGKEEEADLMGGGDNPHKPSIFAMDFSSTGADELGWDADDNDLDWGNDNF